MPTTTVKTIYGRFEDSKEVQLLKLSGIESRNKHDDLLYVMRQVKGV